MKVDVDYMCNNLHLLLQIYAGGLHLNDLLPAFYAADYIKEKIKDVPEDDRFFFKQSYFGRCYAYFDLGHF